MIMLNFIKNYEIIKSLYYKNIMQIPFYDGIMMYEQDKILVSDVFDYIFEKSIRKKSDDF